MVNTLPAAESVNYWKSGRTAADAKLDHACKIINDLGGEIDARAIGFMSGRALVMLAFRLGGQMHRITWPVLETADGKQDTIAARIQAATFVYHDVKAKAMSYKVIGTAAFADIRLIPERQSTARELLYEGSPEDLKLLT